MTPRAFVQSGESESLKGACHATTAALLAIMAAYNIAAFAYRRERHLAANTALYTAGLAWEVRKTISHWT